ncbi:MAG: hypothetical protein C0500_08455 [Sphingobium sp.]|nr:hypothetical protein [Sphingobium sp.]
MLVDRKKRAWLAGLLGGISLACVAPPAHAADKALLIGVGKFIHDPKSNLPGIDLDVAIMQGVAKRLGYTEIKTLRDTDATRAAMLDALKRLLVTEASPNDRVMIYFSGHGTGVADGSDDEDDGQDEALVASDVQATRRADGTPELRGVVIDDEIADLLAKATVKSVIMIIDSCHSGTVDKAVEFGRPVLGTTQGTKKLFFWPGFRPGRSGKGFAPAARPNGGGATKAYVSLTAAGDDQSAIATRAGSVFTVGVEQAIAKYSAGGTITPRQVVDAAAKYIAAEVSPNERFTPEVHGTATLIDAPITLSRTSAGGGPNWTEVAAIVDRLPGIDITGLRDRYVDGQELSMTLNLPSSGYLNVIAVNPDDTVTLLFPNHLQPDNRVEAGKFALPGGVTAAGGQELYFPVVAPYGKTMVVAIVTKRETNLFKTAVDANGGSGLRTPSLAAVKELIATASSERAFGVAARPNAAAWGAKAEMLTCRASGC